MNEWLPVLIAVIVAVAFAGGTILLSSFIVPRTGSRTKLMPYECGVDPLGTARERFSIKFYLVAGSSTRGR
jgi:NADH-quinone oxidoreductase subunit A